VLTNPHSVPRDRLEGDKLIISQVLDIMRDDILVVNSSPFNDYKVSGINDLIRAVYDKLMPDERKEFLAVLEQKRADEFSQFMSNLGFTIGKVAIAVGSTVSAGFLLSMIQFSRPR